MYLQLSLYIYKIKSHRYANTDWYTRTHAATCTRMYSHLREGILRFMSLFSHMIIITKSKHKIKILIHLHAQKAHIYRHTFTQEA